MANKLGDVLEKVAAFMFFALQVVLAPFVFLLALTLGLLGIATAFAPFWLAWLLLEWLLG